MKKTLTLMFVALALVSLTAYALVDVSGTWEMTREGRDGPMTSDITIEQDGSKITLRERQGTEFVMEYKGTVDGDSMSGTMTVMDREIEWTAKKK
jgi:hypothetical protein